MIIREGFVSNSSSTSFTCDACGCIGEESDGKVTEFSVLFSCGHQICGNCVKFDFESSEFQKQYRENVIQELKYKCSKKELKELLNIENFEEFIVECTYFEQYAPSSFCPVCTLEKFNDIFVFQYILKKQKLSIDDIKNEIRQSFKNMKKLKTFLKSS